MQKKDIPATKQYIRGVEHKLMRNMADVIDEQMQRIELQREWIARRMGEVQRAYKKRLYEA